MQTWLPPLCWVHGYMDLVKAEMPQDTLMTKNSTNPSLKKHYTNSVHAVQTVPVSLLPYPFIENHTRVSAFADRKSRRCLSPPRAKQEFVTIPEILSRTRSKLPQSSLLSELSALSGCVCADIQSQEKTSSRTPLFGKRLAHRN